MAVTVPAAVVANASAVVEGSIVATVRRATRGGDEVHRSIAETLAELAELAEAAGVAVDGFAAVGVGIHGLVDREAGTVRHAVNLGLGDEPVAFADHVGDLARAPVVVDNDVNVAAVGAASALRCPGDLAYLCVGTGVAAGFVLGRRIRQGAHGAAGEIGHPPSIRAVRCANAADGVASMPSPRAPPSPSAGRRRAGPRRRRRSCWPWRRPATA